MSAEQPLLSFRQVAELLTLEESRLRYWAQTGLVGPSIRRGGRQFYTFVDVIQVKAAKELVERGLPVQRVRRSLDMLRCALPGLETPLAKLRICSDGERIVVLGDDVAFEPGSGQVIMDFELGPLSSEAARIIGLPVASWAAPPAITVAARPRPSADPAPSGEEAPGTAYGCFQQATLAERASRDGAAELLYEHALSLDPRLAAAHTNLGNIAYRRGDLALSRARYEQALALDTDQVEARYNLGNVLSELGEHELAVAEYRRVLGRSPDFADAHFNLAVTLERHQSTVEARIHYGRYIELDRTDGVWVQAARQALMRLEPGR